VVKIRSVCTLPRAISNLGSGEVGSERLWWNTSRRRFFGLCNDVRPNSLSISNRTCIDNGPERRLLDNGNKDLLPVTVLEVK
jgi:hypothetical protein